MTTNYEECSVSLETPRYELVQHSERGQPSVTTLTPPPKPPRAVPGSLDDITDTTYFNIASTAAVNPSDNNTYVNLVQAIPKNLITVALEDDDVEYAVADKTKSPKPAPINNAKNSSTSAAQTSLKNDYVEYGIVDKRKSPRKNSTSSDLQSQTDTAYDDVEYAIVKKTKSPKMNPIENALQQNTDDAYDDVEYAVVNKTKPSSEQVYDVAEPVNGIVEEAYEFTKPFRRTAGADPTMLIYRLEQPAKVLEESELYGNVCRESCVL